MIFWQTRGRRSRPARAVAVPRARAPGIPELEIVVDTHERYAWTFARPAGHRPAGGAARRRLRRAASAGAGRGGRAQEARRTWSSSLTTGKLRYQLAELASVPRAAVVVEERYSAVFQHERVRPAVVADGLAECQVRFPTVPIVFCETRKLAQEWTYRFLAAALRSRPRTTWQPT